MPYDGPALGPAEIRKIRKGKPDLVKALLEAREAGWRRSSRDNGLPEWCPSDPARSRSRGAERGVSSGMRRADPRILTPCRASLSRTEISGSPGAWRRRSASPGGASTAPRWTRSSPRPACRRARSTATSRRAGAYFPEGRRSLVRAVLGRAADPVVERIITGEYGRRDAAMTARAVARLLSARGGGPHHRSGGSGESGRGDS